ncbi:MAG: LolA family protein [Planctomycetota bacterium]|jgi:outer membrane lipoprotein-sorting protein
MMRRIPIAVLTIIALSCAGVSSATAVETIESVEKKLTEKWNKVRSVSAKVKMEGPSPGMGGTGALELMKRGDEVLFRMEMTLASQVSTIMISDGEFMYAVNDHMGQKMALKMKSDKSQLMTPTAQLSERRTTHELKVLPDQSIDGHAAYVIEATPKQQISGIGKAISYYAKETGVVLRMIAHDQSGNVISNMTFTDVKINPKIDASRFVFTAPPGVQVMDMTNR